MERISTLDLTLGQLPEEGMTAMQACMLGPFLQGLLMESIETEYAGRLHALPFNPYSSRCTLAHHGKALDWRVTALTEEAAEQIIEPLRALGSVTLRATGKTFPVLDAKVTSTSTEELTGLIRDEGSTKARVCFVTPTAFKRAGSYVFIPNVRLMFQNLLMHYYQVYEGSNEVDQETLSYIDQNVVIASYNLRSQYFGHAAGEGRKIPAFVGTVSLRVRGPQPLAGLVRMLLRFGELAGIGIKTAMGMGGMKCL